VAGTGSEMLRRGLLLGLLGLLAATPATASVRPLTNRTSVAGAPALDGARVVYADREGHRAVRILAAPIAGGAASELARVPVPASRSWPAWDFAAGPGGFALRLFTDSGRELWAGPGPLTRVQRRAPRDLPANDAPDLFAVPGGPLTLERTGRFGVRAMLRPPGGPPRPAPLPAGADLSQFAVSGSVAAVRVGEEVVVVELPSGAVLRRVALGAFAGGPLHSLGVSPTGDVALVVEDSEGIDYLGWAPVGAATPKVVSVGDKLALVRPAGGRIALTVPVAPEEGARVVVLDPATGEQVFHGPPAADIRSLDFDGANVSWATDACQFVSDAQPGASTNAVPAGPCLRTEATFGVFNDVRPRGRPPRLPVLVRCLTAPGRTCRVDLRVYTAGLERIGRLVTAVPVASSRVVKVRARRAKFVFVVARVVDPDGRRRVAVML
jgi:hypothetical protein